MAAHAVTANVPERGQVWEYHFWPSGVSTPRWFDNNDRDIHSLRVVEFLWAWMRSRGLIRLRRVA